MKSYYDVLELDKNCTAEEIKNSYLRLSKKYHPDINKSSDAHKKFVQVNEAYSVLGKADKKYEYDENLSFERSYNRTSSSRVNAQYMTYAEYVQKMNMNRRGNYDQGGPNLNSLKIKGLVCCCFLMAIGASLHLKYAWAHKSNETSLLLAEARNQAHKIGYQQAILNFSEGSFSGTSRKDIEENLKKN